VGGEKQEKSIALVNDAYIKGILNTYVTIYDLLD
jgi:hypothetical protein